jgi:hypothetical protein
MTADPKISQDQLVAELHRLRGMGLEVVPVSEKQAGTLQGPSFSSNKQN